MFGEVGDDGGPTPKIMETFCFLQFLGEVGGHGATRPTSNSIENILWFPWFLERWEVTGNTALHPKALKTSRLPKVFWVVGSGEGPHPIPKIIESILVKTSTSALISFA